MIEAFFTGCLTGYALSYELFEYLEYNWRKMMNQKKVELLKSMNKDS